MAGRAHCYGVTVACQRWNINMIEPGPYQLFHLSHTNTNTNELLHWMRVINSQPNIHCRNPTVGYITTNLFVIEQEKWAIWKWQWPVTKPTWFSIGELGGSENVTKQKLVLPQIYRLVCCVRSLTNIRLFLCDYIWNSCGGSRIHLNIANDNVNPSNCNQLINNQIYFANKSNMLLRGPAVLYLNVSSLSATANGLSWCFQAPPICQNSLLLWNRFYSQWRHFVIVQSGHLLSPSGYRGIGLVWNILPSILATFRVILSRSEWYGGPCGSLGSGGSTGFGGCGRSCTSGGSCGSSGNCLALRYAIFLEI